MVYALLRLSKNSRLGVRSATFEIEAVLHEKFNVFLDPNRNLFFLGVSFDPTAPYKMY